MTEDELFERSKSGRLHAALCRCARLEAELEKTRRSAKELEEQLIVVAEERDTLQRKAMSLHAPLDTLDPEHKP